MTTDPPIPAIFLQDACLQHQYIRSRDLSAIVERPERLRAVTIGLSAAIARLESVAPKPQPDTHETQTQDPDELAAAMGRMNLVLSAPMSPVVSIVQSTASLDILNNPAVKYVHGDLEGDVYLAKLKTWARDCVEEIQKGGSEIPEGLSQGDLYLCPQSIDAIQGALGTVCEAVDRVMTSTRDATGSGSQPPVHRAFVAIRPPGHHCGEDTPSGFCFVNNVAVGAAHAHLQYGINRVVIFDIDLHHGNGTQSVAWQINEETYRQTLEVEAGVPTPPKPGLQVYYGSVHDILSYPCEDGKPDLVQAASVSIHGAHGQHIENVHLRPYESEEHFWGTLYDAQYGQLLRKAQEFLEATGGTNASDDVLMFISCGMDASEHEHASMSRHGRKVPAGLYKRFAQDVCALSARYACGRVVSVLEGGYSDRALVSGAMAHLVGLALGEEGQGVSEDEWWSVENLVKLEKATKKRRGGRVSTGNSGGDSEPWLDRTLEIFQSLDSTAKVKSSSSSRGTPVPPPSMTLRERKGKTQAGTPTGGKDKDKNQAKVKAEPLSSSNSTSSEGDAGGVGGGSGGGKKLPRVILRLGPDPSGVSGSS